MKLQQAQEMSSKPSKKYPRGDCYKKVIDYIFPSAIQIHLPHFEKMFVVHGRPKLTRPPYRRYGHAWIEYTDENGMEWVWDVLKDVSIPKELYYEAGTIYREELYKYSPQQALEMCVKFRHYGPWEGRYACPPCKKLKRKK